MSFYALRIVCPNCGASFLVGGSARNDLAPWRRLTVACRRCSAQIETVDGEPVDLRAVRPNPILGRHGGGSLAPDRGAARAVGSHARS